MISIQSLFKNHRHDLSSKLIWNHSNWETYHCLIVLETFKILDMLEAEQKIQSLVTFDQQNFILYLKPALVNLGYRIHRKTGHP